MASTSSLASYQFPQPHAPPARSPLAPSPDLPSHISFDTTSDDDYDPVGLGIAAGLLHPAPRRGSGTGTFGAQSSSVETGVRGGKEAERAHGKGGPSSPTSGANDETDLDWTSTTTRTSSPFASSAHPTQPEADDAATVSLYASSVASSSSGWIMPAPEPERESGRSMMDFGATSDEDESTEDEEKQSERERHRAQDHDEKQQERDWLAWRQAGEGRGTPEGWKPERGSKLDRVLGEGAQWASLPLSTYDDVLSGPGINVQRETITVVSPRDELPPHLRPSSNRARSSGTIPSQGHVPSTSVDSGHQSFLSFQDSDDDTGEIGSLNSAEPFFTVGYRHHQSGHQPQPSYSSQQPLRTSHSPGWSPASGSSPRLDAAPEPARSLSSLTPEEKSRLLRRAKKLEHRLGVTLTGDLIAGSLSPPPPAAYAPFAGRRASDPERMQGLVEQKFQPAAAFVVQKENQPVLRSRGKGGLVRMPSLGFGTKGLAKSLSSPGGAGTGGISTALRPRIAQRSSLPASPSASVARFSLGMDNSIHPHPPRSPRSPTSPTSHSPPAGSRTPQTAIPLHFNHGLVQHSSSPTLLVGASTREEIVELSLPRRGSLGEDDPPESPLDDFGYFSGSPKSAGTSSSEDEVAARKARMVRLSKIHHLMGGEVPAEQLVDGPGTGPWLEPASHPYTSSRPRLALHHSHRSSSKLATLVKEKASELKPSLGRGGRSRSNSTKEGAGGAGAAGGEESSFLRLGDDISTTDWAGMGGEVSKRGLKLGKLFGTPPSPTLYFQPDPKRSPSSAPSSPSLSIFEHSKRPGSRGSARGGEVGSLRA